MTSRRTNGTPERARTTSPVEDLITGADGLTRCGWAGNDAEYRRYHDEEWGRPLHGDHDYFEKISLEAFQSGLSWITILRRRPAFRARFHDFDISAVAAMTEDDVAEAMEDAAIIRNRAKIRATVDNARIVETLVAEQPGLLERIVLDYRPPARSEAARPRSRADVPAITAESTALSGRLRGLGLRFVGPTTMYALMQSAGLVDDHLLGCHRAEITTGTR